MKKFAWISAIVLSLYTVIAIWWFLWNAAIAPFFEKPYTEDVDCLNSTVDVLLYGDDIVFPRNLNCEKVSNIEEDTISNDHRTVYLIINDLDGNLDLSKDEFVYLKEYADEHSNFNYYYLGTDKLDFIEETFQNCDQVCNFDERDMSSGYETREGDKMLIGGIWSKDDEECLTEDNPDMIGENLIWHMYQGVTHSEKKN